MTILVIGAGQLGVALRDHLPADTLFASRSGEPAIDLAQPTSIHAALDRLTPTIIVNAAAYTAVDAAESDEAAAFTVNADAVGAIGAWASAHDALVIHVSTDYVFDGEGCTPYDEDRVTAPINAYGRSKEAGERALRASGAHHVILRTSWLYGIHGHNFLRTMLRLGQDRDHLRVVADQTGAPTTADALAAAIARVTVRWMAGGDAPEGTYHVACHGETTWHGFACAIFASAHRQGLMAREPKVEAITTEAFPTPARRPRYSSLDPSRFERTFDYQLPDWQPELERTLARLNP